MDNTDGPVFEITLNKEQAETLSPIVLAAGAARGNILFAVTVPNWDVGRSETTWLLQAISVPARIGHKIRKLLVESTKPRAAAAATPRVEHAGKPEHQAKPTKRFLGQRRAISQKPDFAIRSGKLAKYADLVRAKEEQQCLFVDEARKA